MLFAAASLFAAARSAALSRILMSRVSGRANSPRTAPFQSVTSGISLRSICSSGTTASPLVSAICVLVFAFFISLPFVRCCVASRDDPNQFFAFRNIAQRVRHQHHSGQRRADGPKTLFAVNHLIQRRQRKRIVEHWLDALKIEAVPGDIDPVFVFVPLDLNRHLYVHCSTLYIQRKTWPFSCSPRQTRADPRPSEF